MIIYHFIQEEKKSTYLEQNQLVIYLNFNLSKYSEYFLSIVHWFQARLMGIEG